MLRRDFLRGSFAAAGLSRLFNLDSVPKPLSFLERVRPTSPTLAYPTLVPEFGQLEDYSSCIFARNDKNIVTASIGDHSAVLWETASGKQLRTFVHGSPVANIAFSPRDNRLLTFGGGSQPVANLWDLATGKKLQTFKHHRERILAGAFSDDGKRIFTASRDDSVCTWSADSTAPQHVIRGIKQIDKAAFAPNPTSLVFTTKDKKLQVLDFSEGTVFRDLPVKPTESWQTDGEEFDHPIIFSPDGSLVAVFANCWGLTIYDFKSRKCLWHTDIPIPAISSMAFTPTSKELLTITSDLHAPSLEPYDHNLMTTTLTLRDAQTGLHPSEFVLYAGDFRNAPQSSAVAISFSDDLIVSGYATGATLMRKQDASSVFQLKGNTNAINSLAINSLSTLLLVGDSTHNAFTWDFGEGAVIETFGPHEIQPLYVHFDEKDEVITDEPNFFRRWPSDRSLAPFQLDRQTPEGWLYPVRDDGGLALMFPSSFHRTDPNQILADAVTLGFLSPFSEEKVANVWSPGLPSKAFQFHFSHFGPALFAPDGHSVFALRDDQVCKLDLSLPAEVWSSPDQPVSIEQIAVSRQGDKVLTGGHDDTAGLAQLWNAENGKLIRNFVGHEGGVTSVAFSHDGRILATGDNFGRVLLWDVHRTKPLVELTGHNLEVSAVSFFPSGDLIATGSEDGTVRLWRISDGNQICTLVANTSGWIVTTPDGRFDTNNLDDIKGFHWVFSDDPFRTLPAEIYLRNYYVPKLLPRVLHPKADDLTFQLPPLQSLNRARPRMLEVRLKQNISSGRVTAEVDVEAGEFTFELTGNSQVSGVYDLRLFRDGQLVAQCPEPKDNTPDGMAAEELKQWCHDSFVVGAGGKRSVLFENLQLPHSQVSQEVVFTAYAFNEVRIKSDVAGNKITPLPGTTLRKAYLINIGVNDYGGSWDLQYAATDAYRMSDVLSPYLEGAGFPHIETITLVSDNINENATKEQIRLAIEDLAGRSTPDDLVIAFFSGHGYSGKHFDFYMLTSDSLPGRVNWSDPSITDLGRMISTNELSRWFNKMVADEIVLIIDACHSAASIQAEGFRPGPLGAKGLGQLAYDKRMRVLAASQSDQSAREMGGQIGAGILTYTLLHDGLEASQAAAQDGKMSLRSWLNYPIKRVPQLFLEIQAGKVNDFGVPIDKDAVPVARADVGSMHRKGALQNPALFDFARREGVLISSRSKRAG